jgi:hypothetical protein
LVEYFFGTLDNEGVERVERYLASSPQARAEFERMGAALRPSPADGSAEPPIGLAEWTARRVAQIRRMNPWTAPPGCSLRLIDWVMAAGLLLGLSMVLFPAVYQARERSLRVSCRENLHQIGVALASYEDRFAGHAPYIGGSSPFDVAGGWASTLLDCQFVVDRATFVCPSSGFDPRRIRTQSELVRVALPPEDIERYLRDLGGTYGYTLGYCVAGGYQGVRRDCPTWLVLVADRPTAGPGASAGESNSPNHGGEGQNVLCAGLQVSFLPSPKAGPDANLIFVNDHRRVAAGVTVTDTVIAPSEVSPMGRGRVPASFSDDDSL